MSAERRARWGSLHCVISEMAALQRPRSKSNKIPLPHTSEYTQSDPLYSVSVLREYNDSATLVYDLAQVSLSAPCLLVLLLPYLGMSDSLSGFSKMLD